MTCCESCQPDETFTPQRAATARPASKTGPRSMSQTMCMFTAFVSLRTSPWNARTSSREAKRLKAFQGEIRKLTNGVNMHIVCDMLRGPVFDAGLAVAARCGVNVSAGWQLSQQVTYNSALQSVKQVTIDHTHYETLEGCAAATALYGSVFKPTVHKEIYAWEDLPRAHAEMHRNTQTGIPIVRVADRLPDAVKKLAP